jgi:hypothetical protein
MNTVRWIFSFKIAIMTIIALIIAANIATIPMRIIPGLSYFERIGFGIEISLAGGFICILLGAALYALIHGYELWNAKATPAKVKAKTMLYIVSLAILLAYILDIIVVFVRQTITWKSFGTHFFKVQVGV